jgi:PII-like signaling protein
MELIPEDGCLLRIFIGESDKVGGQPLYEWIVLQAFSQDLAGATVLRGVMGFGANTRGIQTFKIERLANDMPLVVELVDTREKLETFLKSIEDHITAGLVTMESANVRIYRSNGK